MQHLQTVIENFVLDNESFFEANGIAVSRKGEFALLNYRQDAEPNEYNRWCRALVLDYTGKVRSLPFVRFFNKGQVQAADVDFTKCDLIEKMDGTLIGAFWHEKNIVFHTRRTISSHQPDVDLEIVNFNGKSYSLLQVAKQYVERLHWQEVYNCFSWCYAFELIHDATKVVTEYPEDKWGLYLLNYRSLRDLSDKHQLRDLIGVGNLLGAKMPRTWKGCSAAEIDALIAEHPEDFEGVVARCQTTGERVKIKSPSYVERHHMVDRRTYRYLIPLWLKGEREEIEAYFPDTKELFEDLESALEIFTLFIKNVVCIWQDQVKGSGWTKKDLALAVIKDEPKWLHSYIFKLYDKPWDDARIREWLKAKVLDVRYILEVLNLDGEE